MDKNIKCTPEGETVGLWVSTDEHWLTLRVVDTGIGFMEEDIPIITSRFHRGRTASNYPGNGLDLDIANAVANNHVGKMAFESRVGKGTRVSLEFPRISIL